MSPPKDVSLVRGDVLELLSLLEGLKPQGSLADVLERLREATKRFPLRLQGFTWNELNTALNLGGLYRKPVGFISSIKVFNRAESCTLKVAKDTIRKMEAPDFEGCGEYQETPPVFFSWLADILEGSEIALYEDQPGRWTLRPKSLSCPRQDDEGSHDVSMPYYFKTKTSAVCRHCHLYIPLPEPVTPPPRLF